MDIQASINNFLQGSRKSWAPSGNNAYNAGHPCARHLVYCRLNWQEKPLPDPGMILIFRDGDLHEDAVIRLLQDAGIRIVETQRPFEIPQIQLRGKIDGQIIDPETGRKYPTEIKSMNPFEWEKINSAEDFLKSSKVWVRGYYTQMQIYLFGLNLERGLFILKNKVNGKLKFIWVDIDYAFTEKEWKKLELVNLHVAEKTYPDRIEDLEVCQYCPFKALCLPDQNWNALNIIKDDEILELLKAMQEVKPYADAYEKANDRMKDFVESSAPGDYLFGGRFVVSIKEQKRKDYKIPKDVKDQYVEEKVIKVKKIVDLDAKKEEEADAAA